MCDSLIVFHVTSGPQEQTQNLLSILHLKAKESVLLLLLIHCDRGLEHLTAYIRGWGNALFRLPVYH